MVRGVGTNSYLIQLFNLNNGFCYFLNNDDLF